MTQREILDKARAMRVLNKATARAVAREGTVDEVIRVMGYFDPWTQGAAYAAGDSVLWDGQPLTCRMDHDTAAHPDWTPGAAPTLWKRWHAMDPSLALPFIRPTGTGDAYRLGEAVRWALPEGAEAVYVCLEEGVAHTPSERPEAWALSGAPEGEEATA